MLPVLKGETSSPRNEMFWKRKDSIGARVGHCKYEKIKDKEYLFNLTEDLGEQNDLANEQPETLARLKTQLDEWLNEMESTEPRAPFRDF
jgi:arylsulfatase A